MFVLDSAHGFFKGVDIYDMLIALLHSWLFSVPFVSTIFCFGVYHILSLVVLLVFSLKNHYVSTIWYQIEEHNIDSACILDTAQDYSKLHLLKTNELTKL